MLPFVIPEIKNIITIDSCHYSVQGPGWSYHLHHHYSYELLHCFDGRMTEWIHGESIELAGGDWMLIGPNVRHSTINHSMDAFAYLTIHIGLEDIEVRNEFKSVNFIHIRDHGNQMSALFSRIQQLILESAETEAKPPSSAAKIIRFTPVQKIAFQAIVLSLLYELLKISNHTGDTSHSNRKMLNASEIDLANHIETLLSESVSSNTTIQDLAKQLFISRSHCNEVFKKVYGLAQRKYISMLKLNKAKDMILHSALSIETIGEQLGFSDLSTFSRQFRRWTGLSPLQLRNK